MGFTIDEWEALPWWHTWLYMKEWEAEKKAQEEARENGGEVPYDRSRVPVEGDIADMVDLGVKVEKVSS